MSLKHPQEAARRRAARMEEIDALAPEVRQLVHEYGWTVVKALGDIGVRKPKHVRHIVETILNEMSPVRGAFSQQGVRTNRLAP